MPKVIALVPTDLLTSRLGLPSMVAEMLGDQTVLAHTVSRLAQIDLVDAIVLLHPPEQDLAPLIEHGSYRKPLHCCVAAEGLTDLYSPMHIAARKWSLTSWRGGLGGSTCYDELLPASALAHAMSEYKADSALIVGGDWPLVDAELCRRVLALHLTNPELLQMTFCQAPPGLSGIVAGRELIEQFAEHHTGFGRILTYNPDRPQADPIGRDVCVQIDPKVRACARRFIYDTKRSAALIDAVADHLEQPLADADASTIVAAAKAVEPEQVLPRQVTVELTARRPADGPIVPQYHVALERQDMPLDLALRIVSQLGAQGDTVLTLGGLGDALRYEHWRQVVTAGHAAGVLGICIETDLLEEQAVVEQLLDLPIDVVSVRLNADTAETYRLTMCPAADDPGTAIPQLSLEAAIEAGVGNTIGTLPWFPGSDSGPTASTTNSDDSTDQKDEPFNKVTHNIQHLLRQRNQRWQNTDEAGAPTPGAVPGMPWVVPRLIKTAVTLKDMEVFFERWLTFCGHAVIEPPSTGCGLMPDMALLDMAPPGRFACRQLPRRMTILADGRVALCDQDWLGSAAAGDTARQPLSEIWQELQQVTHRHDAGQWDELELCQKCRQWHRP